MFVASGSRTDSFSPTDADGYAGEPAPVLSLFLRWIEGQRHARDDHWFCLMGSIGTAVPRFASERDPSIPVADRRARLLRE